MPFRRTSVDSSQRTGFYSPKRSRVAGSRLVFPTDPDAAAYIAAVESADGQELEFPVKVAYNDFVLGCKSDGIWTAIKASCIMAGARTLAGALTPLVGTAARSFGFWGDTDSQWSNVSLLVRGGAAAGSTSFSDLSSNAFTVSRSGNTVTSNTETKANSTSIYFDGSGDFLSVSDASALDFPGDFTIEFWAFQHSSPTQTFPILIEKGTGPATADWGVLVNNSGGTGGASFFWGNPRQYQNIGAIGTGAWHHIAIARETGTVRTFLDGSLISETSNTTDFSNTSTLRIGIAGDALNNSYKGYIDDLRITKGVARYVSSFTPYTYTLPTATADYSRTTGLVGDGSTKYLNSNRNNNADPQNNQHLSVWVTTVTGNNAAFIGSRNSSTSTGSSFLMTTGSPGTSYAASRYSGTPLALITTPTNNSLYGLSRSSSSQFIYRVSGASVTEVTTSAASNTDSINVFNRGGVLDLYAAHRLSFYSIGESLDLALLDSRVTTLMADIAAAIP